MVLSIPAQKLGPFSSWSKIGCIFFMLNFHGYETLTFDLITSNSNEMTPVSRDQFFAQVWDELLFVFTGKISTRKTDYLMHSSGWAIWTAKAYGCFKTQIQTIKNTNLLMVSVQQISQPLLLHDQKSWKFFLEQFPW